MSRAWMVVLLSGAGTFAMRASFLVVAHRLTTVPAGVQRVLRQIPPAALASIVVPDLVLADGAVDLLQPRLAAGLLAAVVAWRTRNTAITLVVGMLALVGLQAL